MTDDFEKCPETLFPEGFFFWHLPLGERTVSAE